MPDAASFLSGFNLIKGTNFGGFILNSVTSTHETVTRYREYLYHITLQFSGSGNASNYNDLYYAVMGEIMQERRILSAYGNPYQCVIDNPQDGDIIDTGNGTYTFHLLGHSYRV